MKPRVVLFFVGLLIFIMGLAPIILGIIPQAAGFGQWFPLPGSQIYQAALIILGVVSLSYGLRGEGKKQLAQAIKQ